MPKGIYERKPRVTTPEQRRMASRVAKTRAQPNPDEEYDRGEFEGEEFVDMTGPPPPRYVVAEIQIPFAEEDWKYQFLKQLSIFPNIGAACAAAQVSRTMARKARLTNKKFAECWQECIDSALDQLEQKVFERSLDAWDPGSAGLAKWLLSSHRPEVYSPAQRVDHKHEINTKDDKPIQIQVETVDYRNFLGALAPPDRPLLGGKVEDIQDDENDLFAEFRELSAEE